MAPATDGSLSYFESAPHPAAQGTRVPKRAHAGTPPAPTAARCPEPLICRSPAFQRVLDEARRAARCSATILLQGESGSGKGRIARIIYESGPRRGPFVVWSAPESSAALTLADMFGYKRGAFTGAESNRAGLFESADGGMILADDIDKLDRALQGTLLRFLDDRCVRPIGEVCLRPIDIVFVATTNRSLQDLVHIGEFLPDLANRLTRLVITVPPLRERREDIAPLIGHFIDQFGRAQGEVPAITKEALNLLEAQPWPGNVRQLSGVIENAVFRAQAGVIDSAGVLHALGVDSSRQEPGVRREGFAVMSYEERRTESSIRRALEVSEWNGKEAAKLLDIPLRTFRRYTRKFNIRKRFH